MTHTEIQELLGAYVLDAAEPDEVREIDAHLLECPRCRAEVDAYREAASALASSNTEVPKGLWDRIAASIEDAEPSRLHPELPQAIRTAISPDERARFSAWPIRRTWVAAVVLASAAAVVAIVVLAVEVASLHSQTQRLDSALGRTGLSGAVAQAAIAPHRTVELAASDHLTAATVIISPQEDAYWISSSLRRLPATRTYQLWGVTKGRIVSLGLVGPDPRVFASFRIESSISRVMVNVEPEGGSVQPTTPVLAQGAIRST